MAMSTQSNNNKRIAKNILLTSELSRHIIRKDKQINLWQQKN